MRSGGASCCSRSTSSSARSSSTRATSSSSTGRCSRSPRSGSTTEAARRFDEYGLGAVQRRRHRGAVGAHQEGRGPRRRRRRGPPARAAGGARVSHDLRPDRRLLPGRQRRDAELPRRRSRGRGRLGRRGAAAPSPSPETTRTTRCATEAEAHLLRGEVEQAKVALERAARANAGDFGALATTRRQLRMICETAGIDTDILAAVAGPAVVHFCGHRISDGRERAVPRRRRGDVAREIDEVVARHNVGFAYGSLASGADILWAEALLARGVGASRRLAVRARGVRRVLGRAVRRQRGSSGSRAASTRPRR